MRSVEQVSVVGRKCAEISEDLMVLVNRGSFGDKLPGANILAQQYGVNHLTIHKALDVLADRGMVTRKPSSGTYITRLKRHRTHVLGAVLVTVGMGGHLNIQLASGMQDCAAEMKHGMLITAHEWDRQKEMQAVKSLVQTQHVDGLILWPADIQGRSKTVDWLIEKQFPFVLLPHIDEKIYSDCYMINSIDENGSETLVRHLVSRGHRKIAFVTSKRYQGNLYASHRFDQYKKVLAEAGLKQYEPIYIDLVAAEKGDDMLLENVESLSNIDAVFCVTDYVASIVLRSCLANGLRVPADLTIASYDNTHVARTMLLDTVEPCFDAIGSTAVELLIDEIEGRCERPRHLAVNAETVIRS